MLTQRDLRHIWHPCSQMKDYENFAPLEITSAKGAFLYLNDGRKIIDAISSWWCKSLGHQHPKLKQALHVQLEKFEHVIFANTTNEVIVQLSEKLCALQPSLTKVFYASEGSSAVEIAMKMSLHSRVLRGESHRHQFVALENGYHGETLGALSVSDVGIYRSAYQSVLMDVPLIHSVPYVSGSEDERWDDCEEEWLAIQKQLDPLAEKITAIILEPILQGAAGMKIYSQDFLRRLRVWTAERGIHLIADEIMTGIGRTGKMLACEHADIEPDFICLSKGLTSGCLPFSAVLTKQEIYDVFYDDYAKGKSFLHSHTHSGNALGASVALATLKVMEEENICARANAIGQIMKKSMQEIADQTNKLTQVRSIGAMVAADLIGDASERLGFAVYRKAVHLGALLRPIGNTLYWLPPLNVNDDVLMELKKITTQAINETFKAK